MSDKRDVDAEQDRLVDEIGLKVVSLLQRGRTEKLFGSLTVSIHWKAGVLSKLEVNEQEQQRLDLPQTAG